MALFAKKLGEHLAPTTKQAITACTRYPPLSVIANPLTRKVARSVINAEWADLKNTIDFDYTLKDVSLAGISCVKYSTANTNPNAPKIIYLHGGAFVAGSSHTNASMILPACHLSGCEGIGIDYSLAPENVFPTALDEIEAVYLSLCEDDGVRPENIIVMGDSAGGNLAAASLLRWKRKNIPMPAGVVLISPLADSAGASDTLYTLRDVDPLISTNKPDLIKKLFGFYAGTHDISDPEISPLNGDYEGFPPMLVQVGAREMLLGDSIRLAELARRADVDISLRVWDGMYHLFQMNWSLEESKFAQEDIAKFITKNTA